MKGVKLLSLLLFLIFVAMGCSTDLPSDQGLDDADYDEQVEDIRQDVRRIDFLDVFPTEEKVSLYYHGIAEYGHIVTLDSHTKTEKGYEISYHGVMDDGADGDDRFFNAVYVIEEGKVVEKIDLNDHYKDHSKTLNSIIPNKIVLQGDITEGHSWTYKAIMEGESIERDVTTTITRVEHLPIDVVVFTTETVVNDLDGYLGGRYTETRTYAEGYGLIGFQNTFPLSLNEGGTEVEDFVFGYKLNVYTKIPFESYEKLNVEDLNYINEELDQYLMEGN